MDSDYCRPRRANRGRACGQLRDRRRNPRGCRKSPSAEKSLLATTDSRAVFGSRPSKMAPTPRITRLPASGLFPVSWMLGRAAVSGHTGAEPVHQAKMPRSARSPAGCWMAKESLFQTPFSGCFQGRGTALPSGRRPTTRENTASPISMSPAMATVRNGSSSWSPPESRDDQRLDWAQTFYPGVTDPRLALKVIVPGGDLWNVDIKLAAVPVHRIRGRVLDVRGDPVPRPR